MQLIPFPDNRTLSVALHWEFGIPPLIPFTQSPGHSIVETIQTSNGDYLLLFAEGGTASYLLYRDSAVLDFAYVLAGDKPPDYVDWFQYCSCLLQSERYKDRARKACEWIAKKARSESASEMEVI